MSIERRLAASLRLGAYEGTANERGVFVAQAGEAVKEIIALRAALAAMTASRDRLAALVIALDDVTHLMVIETDRDEYDAAQMRVRTARAAVNSAGDLTKGGAT